MKWSSSSSSSSSSRKSRFLGSDFLSENQNAVTCLRVLRVRVAHTALTAMRNRLSPLGICLCKNSIPSKRNAFWNSGVFGDSVVRKYYVLKRILPNNEQGLGRGRNQGGTLSEPISDVLIVVRSQRPSARPHQTNFIDVIGGPGFSSFQRGTCLRLISS